MDTHPTAPADWLQALERSRADLAAGRVVDGTAVHSRLRESLKRTAPKLHPGPDVATCPKAAEQPVIRYTVEAEAQLDALRGFYEDKERPEAIQSLDAALDDAERRIETEPGNGLLAPRPYPGLARDGEAWIKAGAYWIAYSLTTPPVILAVFHDRANIPGRW